MRAEGTAITADLESAEATLDRARRELDAYLAAVSAADVGAEAFRPVPGSAARWWTGARRRWSGCANGRGSLTCRPPSSSRPSWPNLTVHEQNRLLRAGLDAVVIERGRVAITDRTTVYWKGTAPMEALRGRGMSRTATSRT